MKGPVLNKLHRYVGITMAPFLLVQTLSGLFLDFGLFRRGAQVPEPRGPWDLLLVELHFSPGLVSDAYHLLLGAAILWMAVSGWLLYLRIRRARRSAALRPPAKTDSPTPPGGAP